jgi:hypothetical protein
MKDSLNKIMQRNLNAYGFATNDEYYNYCVDSYINGQFSQCKTLFKQLPGNNKHELIKYIDENHANDEIHNYFVGLF